VSSEINGVRFCSIYVLLILECLEVFIHDDDSKKVQDDDIISTRDNNNLGDPGGA
jgi:hypothetical protein